MPLYEYQCDACGHRFERIQKFSDPLVDTCPVCSGAVRKLMSSPAIQFKGSGFYITDYPKKDKGGEKSDGGSGEKTSKAESASDKAEKSGNSEKTDKSDKSDKAPTPAASEKSAASSSSSSSGSSGSSSSSSTKPAT